jgi:D-glycero-alpha-D-manno-heptose-7-phosphate kinase
MKAIILAGGFGTRLKDIVRDVPKPMAYIMGKPFLEHQIIFLKEQGITDIIITVHHMADTIKTYFGDGNRWGAKITYSEEETPLGTAGAIKNAEKYIDDTFIVLNGDSYSQIDLKEFLEVHKSKRSNATISLAQSQDSSNYGNVILEEGKIINFHEKDRGIKSDFVSSGIYIFEPVILNYIESGKNISLEREIFPKLAQEKNLWSYTHRGYFMDIGKPETYRKFKEDVLNAILLRDNNNIRDAMKKINKNSIDLILVIDDQKRLLGVLNNKLIGNYLSEEGRVDDNVEKAMIRNPITAKITDDENKITELFFSGTHRIPILDDEGRIVDIRFYVDKIKTKNFPIIRGKAPLRISFAGGGTDVSHFFEKYGGVVINSTIDKYCHVTAKRRADSKIVINSEDDEIVTDLDHIEYDGRFDLVKAVINKVRPDFGFELYLYNDIPPGRGLGSSGSFSVLITKILNQLQGREYSDDEITRTAYEAEIEELKIKGGWQDQYAAITGGFSFMEFSKDRTIIYPLKLKENTIHELNSRLLLCYVSKSHSSGELHESQEKNFMENEEIVKERLNNLKKIAINIKDSLLTKDITSIGELLHKSWEMKKKASDKISDQDIDRLYEIGIKNGAIGGKLLGAGGGGYLLFFYSPKKRNLLTKALKSAGGEIEPFNFEFNGVQVWNADNY